MEAVRAFNNELSALYETKPPISRAKMAQLTKCAIKAIKFYKHVVQSVEKFIQKCKPEYKVPGLYVIDSVVRQSRHQFGSNKDVFAPRFTKNIITTFQNLFKCPGDERSKIVRVLNLWQKNDVFPSEIIQPLLDLAADPTKPSALAAAQAAVDRVVAASGKTSTSQSHAQSAPQEPAAPPISQAAAENMLATQNDMLNTVTQLLQQTDSDNSSLSAQQQQLQQLQLLQQQLIQQTQLMQQPSGAPPIIDSNLLAQIQTLTNQLLSKTEPKSDTGGSGFNTKLLDFDYGESDDEEERRQHQQQQQGDPNLTGNVQTILNDSTLMQQIHQMSQNIQKNEQLSTEISEQERRRRVLEQQQAEFDQQISQVGGAPGQMFSGQQPPMPDGSFREEGEYEEEPHDEDFRDHQQLRDRDDRDRRDRRRRDRDERSRSRTPKRRRRTRSRSRDRRRRSRSRERYRRSRSKDKEREKQKEKERERKKKALPPIRENMLTVCSTTIWIGHLNKFTSEEELKAELEHYGPVGNISMVPPRGCAYVVMTHRKDAYKAIDRLKGYKLNGSALKTAWAQSQGIRDSEFKDSWDVEHGAIYIPWESLPPDLSPLLEGGIIDQDTLPDKLKDIPTEKSQLPEDQGQASVEVETSQSVQISMSQQPPLPGQPPLLGMMPGQQPGAMPGMAGMMPGMMMPMQRPLVPGMPPQPMPMPPGAPPQMMPGGPVPTLRPPGAVNPAMGGMSIANSVTSSLPQSIQNVLATTAGVAPNSPARAAFTPGAPPPRFGFNPNMPPPGFRMPPPGFGGPMRPMMPPGIGIGPNKPMEQPDRPPMEGPKQPEIAWPPDSNEKDEDEDEDEDGNKNEGNVFQSGQFAGMSKGPEQPSLLGPRPPGGFPPGGPPGPPGQPWNMPPGMQGMRRPQMGGPNMRPDRFNSPRPPLLGMGGPRGPRFMGNMPPGFPRFPPGGPNANTRGPVPLLDLDLKPPEGFEGETFNDEIDNENAENNDNNESQEREDGKGTYPFNNWSSVDSNRDRDRSGDHDRSRRDRDNWDGRGRDRDRDWRDSRDRDRDRDRHRDRDNDKDWRNRRDRDRDRDRGDRDRDRGDRERDRDRSRREDRPPRASRWSNVEEEDVKPADQGDKSGNVSENVNTSDNMQNNPENSISEPESSAGNEVDENMEIVSEQVSNTVSESESHTESVNNETSQSEEETSNAIQEEPVAQSEPHNEVNTVEAENVENEVAQKDVSEETGPVSNGPVIEEDTPNPPVELPPQPIKTVEAVEGAPVVDTAPENGTEVVQENNEDLEEGEIS